MKRKRIRLTRSIDLRTRRNRKAPPTTGWFKPELAALLGISPGTITKYVVMGVLPPTVFRGRATRYQREHLLRVLAIRELRARGMVGLKRIKAHFEKLSPEQIEELALSRPPSPAILDALSADALAKAPSDSQGDARHVTPPSTSGPSTTAETTVVTDHDSRPTATDDTAQRRSASPSLDETDPPGEVFHSGPYSATVATWHETRLAPGVMLRWHEQVSHSAKSVVHDVVMMVAQRTSRA